MYPRDCCWLLYCSTSSLMTWMMGQSKFTLAILQMIQNWAECLVCQMVVSPFRGTLKGRRKGREEWTKFSKGKNKSCTWWGTRPCIYTGCGLTVWKAAWQRRSAAKGCKGPQSWLSDLFFFNMMRGWESWDCSPWRRFQGGNLSISVNTWMGE